MRSASKKLGLGLFFASIFLLINFFSFTPDALGTTQCKCTGSPIQFTRPSADSCQTICSTIKAGAGNWDAASSNCTCSSDSADFWFADDNANCKNVCLRTHNSFECPGCSTADCVCQTPDGKTWIERSKCTGTKEFSAEANETCKLNCRLFPPAGYSGDVSAITGKCPAYTVAPPPPPEEKIFDETKFIKPALEINIPKLTFTDIASTLDSEGNIHLPWIGEYITAIYKFAMVAISILGVVMIIIQGAKVASSGYLSKTVKEGGKESVVTSYKKIGQIVVGLMIAWGSYAILFNINPDLVKFKALKIQYIKPKEMSILYDPPDIQEGVTTTGNNNVPYFTQCKRQWANEMPGGNGCGTICGNGCGVTSLAMVLGFYGKNVDPLSVVKTDPSSIWKCGQWDRGKTKKNWASLPWSDLTFQSVPNEKGLELAASGKPIIFGCKPCVGVTGEEKIVAYPAHYMVLTGSPDGGRTFTINDPGWGKPKGIVSMTREQILKPSMAEYQLGITNYKGYKGNTPTQDELNGNFGGSVNFSQNMQNGLISGTPNSMTYIHP